MTCPTCTLLRAQLDDAERHADTLQQRLAELTGGDPDPIMVATSATIAKLRATVARLIPRWRAGEPPRDAQVWREYTGAKGPVVVYTFAGHNDGRIMYYGFGDDEPKEWGTARWAPIPNPEEP